jgi:hypothetical protein
VQGFSRLQVKAGVMPWTPYGLVDDKPVTERPIVVRAFGADREHLRPAPHQQHRLVAEVADQLASVGKFGKRNSLG